MALPRKKALVRIEKEYNLFMKKYFPKETIPTPTFRIRKLRKAVGSYRILAQEINIHPDCFMSKKTLRDTVWHEAIHHVDRLLYGTGKRENKGHGKFFVEQMNRVNKKEGRDVITVKLTKPFERVAKKYFLHFFFGADGVFIMWSNTPLNKLAITGALVYHAATERSENPEVYTLETDLAAFTKLVDPITAKVFRTQNIPMGHIGDDTKLYRFFDTQKKTAEKHAVPDSDAVAKLYEGALDAYLKKRLK